MEDNRICRICLVVDVKLYTLHSYSLNIYLETLVGMSMLSTELPPYICYECAALLQKCFYFREKCLRGQAALYDILGMQGKIDREAVTIIDRKNIHVASRLTVKYIDEIIVCEERERVEVVVDEIKEEPVHEFDYTDCIKVESCDEYIALTSDDDKPLSVHKIKKEKKTKKGKRGRKRKEPVVEKDQWISEFEIGTDSENPQEAEDLKPIVDSTTENEPNVPVKRKPGRPRKTDKKVVKIKRRARNNGGEYDEGEMEDYVTIINLSIEEQKDEITKRQHSSNYENAQFKCSLCFKGFIDTSAWKHHSAKHDPSAGDMECDICRVRFKTRRSLQKHAANHEKKYACKACPYVSKTTTQAKQHQRWHKGVTYKCQYCDEVLAKWTSYLSHVRMKHPSEFICEVCGYSFVSRLGLNMHRTMMHKDRAEKEATEEEKAGPYCTECDVKFVSTEAWKRHLVTSIKHSQRTDFNAGCRVCGETFGSGEELRTHHRRQHARARPKNYGKRPSALAWPHRCLHCSEEIPNAREYWTHFRRMHPDKDYPIQKDYVCDICGKSFRGNAFLVYHKRTHGEERAYPCAQCGKRFHNRTNLHTHRRTHSDLRPHACSLCHKAFKCKGALDRHFRSHTGVKPYVCEVCGKAFAQSNSRNLHVKTVHLRQPSPYVSRSRLERRKATAIKEQPAQTFLY